MKMLPEMMNTRALTVCMLVMLACLLAVSCKSELNEAPDATKTGAIKEETALLTASDVHTRAQVHNHMVLFNGGTDGYHSYRIPSIIKTTNGTLLAFAEGRRWGNGDFGDINLVYKRSTDHGNTWSGLLEVVGTGPGTWGNPTAVTDWDNGRVWLFMSWNSGDHTSMSTIDEWGERSVYASYSDDDGLTWSTPEDMTNTLLPPGYTWDAMGPGIGIQTRHANDGRLIIPATRRNIYSDDGGQTWQYQMIPSGTGEGTIVEQVNGQLTRNDRAITTQWNFSKRRRISTGSIENGFPEFTSHNTLLDPKCEASIIRYTDSPDRIIFLNPASTIRRCKMRVRISYDGGQTWPISRRTHDWLSDDETCNQGKGGYSSMIKTADYAVGALIEINEDVGNNSASHRSIEFHKFNLPWILNGTPEP